MPDSNSSTDAELSYVSEDATFQRDVECRGCGYNLRGVRILGRCPECNYDSRESLLPHTLQFMDPRWLRRVRLGLRVTFVGLCLHFAPVIGIFIAMIIGFYDPAKAWIAIATIVPAAWGFVLARVGEFLTTPANPVIDRVPRWRRVRILVRSSVVVVLSAAAVTSFLLALWSTGTPPKVLLPALTIGWIGLVALNFSFSEWLTCLAGQVTNYDRKAGKPYSGKILSGSIGLIGAFTFAGNLGFGRIAGPTVAILLVVIAVVFLFHVGEVNYIGQCAESELQKGQRRLARARRMSP